MRRLGLYCLAVTIVALFQLLIILLQIQETGLPVSSKFLEVLVRILQLLKQQDFYHICCFFRLCKVWVKYDSELVM